jgi:hypothetical protein
VDGFLARNDLVLRKTHPESRIQIDSAQVRWFLDALEIAKTRYRDIMPTDCSLSMKFAGNAA